MNFDFFFILLSILIITILIIVHEFGHYLAARYFGFQTPIFGIGLPFGPYIDLFKKWGTQFRFHFLLIGGFVSIPELGDETTATDTDALKDIEIKTPLQKFPVWQRAIVASGGIVFNIIFAYLLCVVMAASVGIPHVVASNKVTGFVSSNPAAKNAGVLAGEKVIAVNSQRIENGKELREALRNFKSQEVEVRLLLPATEDTLASERTIALTTSAEGSMGVVLDYKQEYKTFGFDPASWLWESFIFIFQSLFSMLISILALLSSLISKLFNLFFPHLSFETSNLEQVKGIVGIVEIISHDLKDNLIMVFQFTILLSLNLAVINMLPIPALDGGHLAFMAYEAFMGRKASAKIQEISIQFGFLFLLAIIAITTVNDIKNWIFH